jgi:hypothetical protein
MKSITVLFLTLLVLSGCSDEPKVAVEPLKGTLNNEGKPFKLKTTTYANKSQLDLAYKESKLKTHKGKADGWSGWNIDGTYCEIHVVQLQSQNDTDQMETWGHELAHCVYGSYHEQQI